MIEAIFIGSLKSHQTINRNSQVQCSSDLQSSSRKEVLFIILLNRKISIKFINL